MDITYIEITNISDEFKAKLSSVNLTIMNFGSSYYIWDTKQDKEIFEFYYNTMLSDTLEYTLIQALNSYFRVLIINDQFKKSIAYKGYLRLQMVYPFLIG